MSFARAHNRLPEQHEPPEADFDPSAVEVTGRRKGEPSLVLWGGIASERLKWQKTTQKLPPGQTFIGWAPGEEMAGWLRGDHRLEQCTLYKVVSYDGDGTLTANVTRGGLDYPERRFTEEELASQSIWKLVGIRKARL